MDVKGVLGHITYEDGWITITKTARGARPAPVRLRAADITGTRFKPGNRLLHGYVQFLLPGSVAAAEKNGIPHGGRPPYSDPHSLSIPRRSNDAANKLVAAVEQARG